MMRNGNAVQIDAEEATTEADGIKETVGRGMADIFICNAFIKM